jgi:hypothetical protein
MYRCTHTAGGQVRLVRPPMEIFRSFLRQQTDKRVDKLLFARSNGKRIKGNRLGFLFAFLISKFTSQNLYVAMFIHNIFYM